MLREKNQEYRASSIITKGINMELEWENLTGPASQH